MTEKKKSKIKILDKPVKVTKDKKDYYLAQNSGRKDLSKKTANRIKENGKLNGIDCIVKKNNKGLYDLYCAELTKNKQNG